MWRRRTENARGEGSSRAFDELEAFEGLFVVGVERESFAIEADSLRAMPFNDRDVAEDDVGEVEVEVELHRVDADTLSAFASLKVTVSEEKAGPAEVGEISRVIRVAGVGLLEMFEGFIEVGKFKEGQPVKVEDLSERVRRRAVGCVF